MPYIALVERDEQGRDRVVGWEEYRGTIPAQTDGRVRYSNYVAQSTDLPEGYIYYIVDGALRRERILGSDENDKLTEAKKDRIEYINAVYGNLLGRHVPPEVLIHIYAHKDRYNPLSSKLGVWIDELHALRDRDIRTILDATDIDTVNSVHPDLNNIKSAPLFDLANGSSSLLDTYTIKIDDIHIVAGGATDVVLDASLFGRTICGATFVHVVHGEVSGILSNASEDQINIQPSALVFRYKDGTTSNAADILQGGMVVPPDAISLEITMDKLLLREMSLYVQDADKADIYIVDTETKFEDLAGPKLHIEPLMMVSQIKVDLTSVESITGLVLVGSVVSSHVGIIDINLRDGELVVNNSNSTIIAKVIDTHGNVLYTHTNQGESASMGVTESDRLQVEFTDSTVPSMCSYNIRLEGDKLHFRPIDVDYQDSTKTLTITNNTDTDMIGHILLDLAL